jgi:transcriptional regulator with XRE-family HTH domain
MSIIGNNIKKIRIAKKLTQTEFAKLFGLKRTALGAYEEGRSEPKIDILIQISEYFRLSIESLIKKEITVNEIFHFRTDLLFPAKSKNLRILQKEFLCEAKITTIADLDNHFGNLDFTDFLQADTYIFEYPYRSETEKIFSYGDIIFCVPIPDILLSSTEIAGFINGRFFTASCDKMSGIAVSREDDTDFDIEDIDVLFEIVGFIKNRNQTGF